MSTKLFLKTLVVSLLLLIFFNCKNEKDSSANDKVEVRFTKEGILNLKKGTTDSIIKTLDIELAEDSYETQTGLMYRTQLGTNQGMLFIFPDEQMRSFYMKNTKIPLDIVYIDKNLQIVSFQKNAKPFDETSLPSEAPAKYVLEINAGLSDEWQLEVGDKIDYLKN
ncbi:DUF192 domain-containing protein [Winogradskyella aquimaris]|uniref:DUF192 domain-containing protein n=1 Tax=Winogradskyella aquimaris TaxID=864074 RepID=A0ABU5EMM1_9FLAO|nr:DUF192 domain-containing protein [Winogradskyella aquimaris]MDY2587562.1 DUF192 domain-containing protein [Winogradskyella aquimaris]